MKQTNKIKPKQYEQNLNTLRKNSPHTLSISNQQVDKRSKMKCSTCGNSGIVYPKYRSTVGYGGSGGEDNASMCPKCYGLSCAQFFLVESGGGYFAYKAKPLW